MTNGTPERRSIFGGVVLILLGILFLLAHFYPGFHLGQFIRHWWPLLLIFLGVARLLENLGYRSTGGARGISGGEITLIVLVLIVGLAAVGYEHVVRQYPEAGRITLFGRPYSFTEQAGPQAVAANAPITINVDRGSITVLADETAQVRVTANKTATASNEESAKQEADQVHVSVNSSGGGVTIQPTLQSETEDVRVDLEVHVPKQTSINARSTRGDITISGVTGTVTAHAGKGDVEIRETGGDVSAEMQHGDTRITNVKGDVHISGPGSDVEVSEIGGAVLLEGEYYGSIRFSHVAKTVRFVSQRTDMTLSSLPGRAEFDSGNLEVTDVPSNVSIITRNKDITLDDVRGRIHVENRHGDINVQLREPPTDEISITNDSGGIELTLPAKSAFVISAATRNGEIQNEFTDPSLKPVETGDFTHLEGKVGARGPAIHLTTSYGTIRLRRGA